ncbi:dynamin-2A-like [Olea europaea subsp. europaea]|uniref:Dynamin-2A-like n=1 Tax=Olea europaea subsp. europaea TaxID=158383 RepID=A0A8S0S281_OLEEU|nr:dynamin-2A-like [Olea europaea subsp. europaea]
MIILMDAIEELSQLSHSMRQAAGLLADEDIDETPSSASSKCSSTFLNVVALGNTGAGKSAVLNSLIRHPALPTGEDDATRAPVCIDLTMDSSLSSKSIILQTDSKSQQASATLPLKLIDLPGADKGNLDDSFVNGFCTHGYLKKYAEHNDVILLVVIPAVLAPEVATLKAIRIVKELGGECTRTVGFISKIDQAASEPKVLAAVQALLLNQGPRSISDIPCVAVIGQSVSIASAQSGSVGADNSLETAW